MAVYTQTKVCYFVEQNTNYVHNERTRPVTGKELQVTIRETRRRLTKFRKVTNIINMIWYIPNVLWIIKPIKLKRRTLGAHGWMGN